MGYRFDFDPTQNLVIIVFEGEISPEEEAQAIRDVAADARMQPDARILVDRTRARMTMRTEHTQTQIALIMEHLSAFGKPKVAIAVSRDYDFGMVRMFELIAEGTIPHDLMVFRSTDEACDWLGLDPNKLAWP